MNVLVVAISWDREMPIATVRAGSVGAIFRISLLHRSYMKEHNIGLGSELRVSHQGYIQHIIKSTRYVGPPAGIDAFDKWFLLKQELHPYLSNHVIRILFLNGIETKSESKIRQTSVDQL